MCGLGIGVQCDDYIFSQVTTSQRFFIVGLKFWNIWKWNYVIGFISHCHLGKVQYSRSFVNQMKGCYLFISEKINGFFFIWKSCTRLGIFKAFHNYYYHHLATLVTIRLQCKSQGIIRIDVTITNKRTSIFPTHTHKTYCFWKRNHVVHLYDYLSLV